MVLDTRKWYKVKIEKLQYRNEQYNYVDYITIIERKEIKIQFTKSLELGNLGKVFKKLNIPIKKDNYRDLVGKWIMIKPCRIQPRDCPILYVIQGRHVLTNIKYVGQYERQEKLKELADKNKIGTKIYVTKEFYDEMKTNLETTNIGGEIQTLLGLQIIIVNNFAIHSEFKNRPFKGVNSR